MTASQLATHLGAKRAGKGKWLAKCPSHSDRNASLSIKEGHSAILIHCWSGCPKEAVLEAAGLKYSDLFYGERPDPKALRKMERKRRIDEERAANLRIGDWILHFAETGYTLEDRQRDIASICASAVVLSSKITPHWQRIFEVHMERIAAADHCRERGMLPNV